MGSFFVAVPVAGCFTAGTTCTCTIVFAGNQKWLLAFMAELELHGHRRQHRVYYAFVSIDAGTYQLLITQPDDQMLPNFTATLHSKTPPAKALLSIGGAKASPSTFSQMVSSKTNRAAFIDSTVAAARKYNLDWEYPSKQEDTDNLGVLFEEWREAVEKEELLITAAVYFSSRPFVWGVNQTYPGESIRRNVDWVNIMSFDYKGLEHHCAPRRRSTTLTATSTPAMALILGWPSEFRRRR